MKVTYLLGAGASYKAIPIIGELNDAFEEMRKLCNISFDSILDQGNRDKSLFDAHMQKCEFNSKMYGTIDTFAKKLALTNPQDLIKLKGAISLFFTFWQEIDKSELHERRNDNNTKSKFLNIDDRYFGLLGNFMEKDSNGKIGLNNNVNFISWNYDAQLELAIAFFLDSYLEKILEEFEVYPYITDKKSQIIHLNGIAGIFKDQNDQKMKCLFGNSFNFKRKTKEMFSGKLHFMGATEDSKSLHSEYFSYAWEDDIISKQAVKLSENIMKNTDILIIIGYSFPIFNDKVDKTLLEHLKKNRDYRIYYQDPNASKELLYSRFGIPDDKITVIKDTKQFALPLEPIKSTFSIG